MKFKKDKNLIISVVMITYNHEKFISKAIEGVLNQQLEFQVELIIADDNSPDHTPKIVEKIRGNHPNGHWIKYWRHEKNLGMMPNFKWALNKCKGDYIAICEGDDYWIDDFKLKKQVKFLEENSLFGVVFTDFDQFFDNNNQIIHSYHKKFKTVIPKTNVFEYLLYKNPFVTCTSLFRSSILESFNYDFEKNNISARDYCLWLHISANWKVGYIDSNTAVYRILENSASHSDNFDKEIEFKQAGFQIAKFFAEYYNVKFNEKKRKRLVNKALIKSIIQKNKFRYLVKFKQHPFFIFEELVIEKVLRPLISIF